MKTKEICARICSEAQAAGFVDPITGLPPHDEVTLSALLCVYHQAGRLQWSKVPLRLTTRELSSLTADALFGRPGLICSEYPLFYRTDEELKARGGMKPDLLLVDHQRRWAIFVEAKIGAGETHKKDSFGGQFGRYAMVLTESGIQETYLIVLTSAAFIERNPPWYVNELRSAVSRYSTDGRLKAFVVMWEDVIKAIVPQGVPGT